MSILSCKSKQVTTGDSYNVRTLSSNAIAMLQINPSNALPIEKNRTDKKRYANQRLALNDINGVLA